MRTTNLYTVLFITFFSFSPSAFAYLDPGTGSMVISAIVGIFATAYLALKTYWYKLTNFFKGKKKNDTDQDKE